MKREKAEYFTKNGDGGLKKVSLKTILSYHINPGHFLGELKIYFIRRFKFLKYNILRSRPRRSLEYRILPHFFGGKEFQNTLLVGVSGCTAHYEEIFNNKNSVHTIDVDSRKAISGIQGKHIVDSIEKADIHFPKDSFDAVIMNGVYGWGLNDEQALIRSLETIRKVLRPGGVLVFGWDRTKKHDPIDLESKDYFKEFSEYKISGVSRIALNDKHNHIYSFYQNK